MPRGVYDHTHRRKNQSKTSTGSLVSKSRSKVPVTHVNELPSDTTNLILQNGDREMVKGLLEKRLSKANKRVAKIKGLLEQLPA